MTPPGTASESPPLILYVDDEQSNLDTFRFNFGDVFSLLFANSPDEALELLRTHSIAVVIADLRMPRTNGLELLETVHEISPDTVGLILTAYADVDNLVQAINSGFVYRYIQKPWTRETLELILRQAMERHQLIRQNRELLFQLQGMNQYLRAELAHELRTREIIGASAAIQELKSTIARVAPGNATVLLRGESGTGKELVARAIHESSSRRDEAFVRVNCAALAPGLLESELFGHERGAFTGAISRRLGRFELADKGTIFLDEVGDLAPEVQIRLLRVLQEREFERVGGTKTIKINVRVISATNRPLENLLEDGMYREDLYYRLNVFPIVVPPLRERLEDIPLLAEHFIQRLSTDAGLPAPTLTPSAEQELLQYGWPGNVRELENVIERALIVSNGGQILEEDLSFLRRESASASTQGQQDLDSMLHALERDKLKDALERNEGRVAEVARELGVNRTTLYYRLKKHGLT